MWLSDRYFFLFIIPQLSFTYVVVPSLTLIVLDPLSSWNGFVWRKVSAATGPQTQRLTQEKGTFVPPYQLTELQMEPKQNVSHTFSKLGNKCCWLPNTRGIVRHVKQMLDEVASYILRTFIVQGQVADLFQEKKKVVCSINPLTRLLAISETASCFPK